MQTIYYARKNARKKNSLYRPYLTQLSEIHSFEI